MTVNIFELKCWYNLPANIPINEIPKYTMLPKIPNYVSFISYFSSIYLVQAGKIPWSRLIRTFVNIISENITDGGLF